MKPLEPFRSKTVYILVKFDSVANLAWLTCTKTGMNYWDTLEQAQNQQLIEQIKNNLRWHIFELELPV